MSDVLHLQVRKPTKKVMRAFLIKKGWKALNDRAGNELFVRPVAMIGNSGIPKQPLMDAFISTLEYEIDKKHRLLPGGDERD